MPKQKVSEKFIIKQSLKVFRSKGYHSTSMTDIAKACGLLKGSLYHYFKGKEALMTAVIDYMHGYYKNEVFAYAYDKKLGTKQKLQLLADIAEEQYFASDSGCLMGNLALETAGNRPAFSALVKAFFEEWMAAMEHIFKEKYENEKAKQMARECVASVEGAVMMMRLFNDQSFLKQTHETLMLRFENG